MTPPTNQLGPRRLRAHRPRDTPLVGPTTPQDPQLLRLVQIVPA